MEDKRETNKYDRELRNIILVGFFVLVFIRLNTTRRVEEKVRVINHYILIKESLM